MNLQTTWQDAQPTDAMLTSVLDGTKLESLQSLSPLTKLKRSLLIGIAFGRFNNCRIYRGSFSYCGVAGKYRVGCRYFF